MKCPTCNRKLKGEKDKYRYTECGLDNVYLMTKVYKCKCGEIFADIPNIYGLHTLIARYLIIKASPLTGKEIRFLRKELLLKANELATILGVTKVTVSRWENDKEKIGLPTDKLIRLFYIQKFQEKCKKIINIVDGMKQISRTAKAEKIIIPKEEIKKACHF
jgi:putative zinc finger/helix-turn-helix YgiT family protein